MKVEKYFLLEGKISGVLEKEQLEIGLDIGMRQTIHRFLIGFDLRGMHSNRNKY